MTEPRPSYGYGRRPATQRIETQRDAQAALATRTELGPEYEEHVAAGLADRVEELVAYRTAELRHRSEVPDADVELEKSARRQRFVLGIVSLGAGIPITAISAAMVHPSLLGIAVSWVGIVGVNVAQRWTGRRSS